MPIDYTRLSKSLARALRHAPEDYGLKLDNTGWVAVDDVLTTLRTRRREWHALTESDLETMIARSSKRRYELLDGRIRAYYGHSVSQTIEKIAVEPPKLLLHGTAPRLLPCIAADGLKPMSRHYVHLSTDEDTARIVGSRRAKHPVILVVQARDAHTAGVQFYPGNEDVWLADPIPPQFIEFP